MDDQLLKWLNGEIDEDQLRQTVDPADIRKYKQILAEVDSWVPDNDSIVFDPKEVIHNKKNKAAKHRRLFPLSIAASVLIVISAIVVWLTMSTSKTSYSTGIAETREITLPDGLSKVVLASGSTVHWLEEDWTSDHRKITLSGKALFQVEKGSPFEVATTAGRIEVLGTTFEVETFSNTMHVACYEGKVKATATDNQAVVLAGGEARLHYAGKWEAATTTDSSLPSWLGNETKFKKAPLDQVIQSLEKQYGLKAVTKSINLKRRFTGSYPNNNLDLALRIVFKPLNIKYEIKGNQLYLSE